MFVRQPQFRNANADVQVFYTDATWNKPPGVSQVYMLLIGGGADGTLSPAAAGASGAVTRWWGSAKNVPDSLVVNVSTGNASDTIVKYRTSNGLNDLLTAQGASSSSAPGAASVTSFGSSGLFQSVGGTASGTSASTTTFLQAGTTSGTPVANYGYTAGTIGFFQLSPIIVGCGALSNRRTGIGCGSAGLVGGGGRGLVIIASW